MLSKENSLQPVIAEKIYFPTIGRRLKDDNHFKRIATALFSNKQLNIQYHARGQTSQQSNRTISAQKLIYYRDNWYLVAHCHYRNKLRVFSIDRIHSAQSLEQPAQIVDKEKLRSYLDSSYGIFTGKMTNIAVLEFTKSRANWVADEHWHPDQQNEWLENGNYQLKIPFSDTRELIMDILKHGAEVKVVSPTFLRDLVTKEIKKMQKNYHNLTK
jgi:predicted DNA-binding transcriptional regulator YafY